MAQKWKGRGVVGSPITVDVNPRFNTWTATFNYYTDSTYTTELAPTAGTIAVTCVSYPDELVAAFSGSAVDATSLKAFAFLNGDIKTITVTPTGILTAVNYEVIITGTD